MGRILMAGRVRWSQVVAVAVSGALLLTSWPEAASGAGVAPAQDEQAQLADQVRELLGEDFRRRGQSLDGLDLAYVGQPLGMPDHASEHTPPTPTTAPGVFPEQLVLVMAHRDEDVQGVYRIDLGAGTASVDGVTQHLLLGRNDPPLMFQEWIQTTFELDRFFLDLIDIRRGPERFDRYLSPRLQVFGGFPRRPNRWSADRFRAALSEEEFRRFATLVLDATIHSLWLALEDRCTGSPCLSYWMDSINALGDTPDELRQALPTMQSLVDEFKGTMEGLGGLSDAHILSGAPFLRRFAGEGLIGKERNGRRFDHLPADQDLYLVRALPYFHFAREDGELRIVAIYFGG